MMRIGSIVPVASTLETIVCRSTVAVVRADTASFSL
jgi:hypothetical protein